MWWLLPNKFFSPEIWWYWQFLKARVTGRCLVQEHRLLCTRHGSSFSWYIAVTHQLSLSFSLAWMVYLEFAPMKLMPPRAVWTWIILILQRHNETRDYIWSWAQVLVNYTTWLFYARMPSAREGLWFVGTACSWLCLVWSGIWRQIAITPCSPGQMMTWAWPFILLVSWGHSSHQW